VKEGSTHTGTGAGFVREEFDAVAGTGTTRDGSTNVQSTLGMYKKEIAKREGPHLRTLEGGQVWMEEQGSHFVGTWRCTRLLRVDLRGSL
jgi:hypothetical protein